MLWALLLLNEEQKSAVHCWAMLQIFIWQSSFDPVMLIKNPFTQSCHSKKCLELNLTCTSITWTWGQTNGHAWSERAESALLMLIQDEDQRGLATMLVVDLQQVKSVVERLNIFLYLYLVQLTDKLLYTHKVCGWSKVALTEIPKDWKRLTGVQETWSTDFYQPPV